MSFSRSTSTRPLPPAWAGGSARYCVMPPNWKNWDIPRLPRPCGTIFCEHYAGGHLSGKVCLFQKSKDRRCFDSEPGSPRPSAAKMLGLRHGAVAKLVQEGILKGRLHHGRATRPLDRPGTSRFRRVASSGNFEMPSTSRPLQSGWVSAAMRFLDLIHGGSLPRAVRTAKGWLIPACVCRRSGKFLSRLPAGKPTSPGWLSLRQATRLFGPTGLTLALLFELIRTQKVSARMADPAKRLQRDRRLPCGSFGAGTGDP